MIRDYCAGGLVFCEGKLLILKRFNGVWLFPKGHIDPGETAMMAAIREVKEESGLLARIIGKLGQTSYSFTENVTMHFKTVEWFLMEALSQEISLEKDFFQEAMLINQSQVAFLSYEQDRELAAKGFEIYQKRRGVDQ